MNQFANSLEIFAQLAVSVGEHEFSVHSVDGAVINIELPNVSAGWALLKQRPARRQRARTFHRLQMGLLAYGSRLEFRIAGRTVATLGTSNPTGVWSAILGLRPLQLFPAQIILAWGKNFSR
jgi:hypothetical protein